MSDQSVEEVITKRKVTLRNVFTDPESGQTRTEEVTDYVPDDVREGKNVLDAYVTEAKQRWQYVIVGELDAGEGGYHGQTHIPADLDHPLAGVTFEATTPGSEQ